MWAGAEAPAGPFAPLTSAARGAPETLFTLRSHLAREPVQGHFTAFPSDSVVPELPQPRSLRPPYQSASLRVVLCPAKAMKGGCLSFQARRQAGRGSGSPKPLCFIVRVGEEGPFLQPRALCPGQSPTSSGKILHLGLGGRQWDCGNP